MSERPVLSLRRSSEPPAPPARAWVCKPCGARFEPPQGLAPEEAVRCPNCNAKLGKAGDFADPSPTVARLRARPAPPPVAAPVVPRVLITRKTPKKVWMR